MCIQTIDLVPAPTVPFSFHTTENSNLSAKGTLTRGTKA